MATWIDEEWLAALSLPAQLERLLEGIVDWARDDERVGALVVVGSVAAGSVDEWSDVDVAVVTGQRDELWDERALLADSWYSDRAAIIDVTRLRPYLCEVVYQGMVSCDVAFEGSIGAVRVADPQAVVVVDRAEHRHERPASSTERAELPHGATTDVPTDVTAWLWLWDIHKHLRRGHLWVAHLQIASFAMFQLLPALSGLPPGDDRAYRSLRPRDRARLEPVLPAAHTEVELRRALLAAAETYNEATVAGDDVAAVAKELLDALSR